MTNIIETERLKLICADEAMLHAVNEGGDAIGKLLNVNVPVPWTENDDKPFRYSLEKISSSPDDRTWWTYFHVLKSENMLTGTCGFKGPRAENGIVDFGYETAEAYRNRGLATELAKALIQFAFKNDRVKMVMAHTLAEENASAKVLRKCGLKITGEDVDEEVGKVWRWEISRQEVEQLS